MRYTTIAIIYNPHSTGASTQLAQTVAAQLRARLPQQKIELIATKHAGHGETLAYAVATSSSRPLIIASSGDGGYHEVVNGALKAQREGWHPTTGVLPGGNANDHHRNLHRQDIVEQIATGQSRQIDLLKLAGTSHGAPIERYAHSYIGFGLTPLVAQELNRTTLNPFKEAWTVIRSLLTIRPVRLTIGDTTRAYESVVCSNVDIMSKYLKISRPSSVTDGKFEVTIFTHRNKLRLLIRLLQASLRGVQEDMQVREFSLATVGKTLVQADGEIIALDAHSSVHITSEQQVLTCVV